ncbi:crotonase/enoyl-CoA hydratase family protein [Dietzia lutea]|uniref:Enoyl-CoA hydratase n=1 Tax=Dietzia lutea TaxID=546160 RepID=A0A2S1R9Y5_9ACTN|nr:crotonase/enoyl-CoA hydratase family protein [Dietzia lutea]AWH93093.1 enoyl-CoA hydratase [Dietzia lutea]
MTDTVWVEDSEGVRIIHIRRPEARNSIDLDTAKSLSASFEDLDSHDEARVGVLVGDGGWFSAGMDLKAFRRSGERPVIPGKGFGGLTERPPSTPLIAAVEGFAFGGGFEMALACDLIVVAEDAVLGLPEVRRGVLAAGGGLVRLPRLIPRNVASEVALTGEPLTAQRAHELGLVARLTAPGKALAGAIELARQIAKNAPLAVHQSKRIMRESADRPVESAFDFQRPLADEVLQSQDAREGAAAFADKRPPRWSGR